MIELKLKTKALSVNNCWQGRRFKTDQYDAYERELFAMLPKYDLSLTNSKLAVSIKWGFSSKASDIDNPTKPLLDILQKKWHFNDKTIYQLKLAKEDVKKGQEFIEINVELLSK